MKVLILIALVAVTNAGILPELPALPSLGSGGGMSYLEMLSLANTINKSPIGKLMPSVTEMISMAWKINQASNTAQESWTKTINALKAEVDKAAALIPGGLNFNVTSFFNNLPKPAGLTNLLPSSPVLIG